MTVVSGYTGLVHSDALRTYNSSVMIRTRGEFPPAFSAGVSEDGQGVLVSLTGSAPASGTLAFEVFNIDPRQAPNYVVGTLAQSVIVSVAAVEPPAQVGAEADYLRGFTVDLNFPSGYESVDGRSVTILYPLPREGALAASKEVCETLGGAHTADLDVCTGYSASSDHAPFVSEALKNPFAPATPPDDLSLRGACTWSAEWWLASAYYSCESAFAQARACNLANKAAKDNGSCAEAECGAGEFALGGKCLALRASGGRLEHAPTGAGNALPAGSHVIAARMTQSDLLGTVRLDVTATIARLSLNAADFSLSEPEPSSVVTVAAGALNVELARVWLTASALSVSEFGAHVSGVDKSAFPANLSLDILPVPENQTVVFYLSGTLAAGSEAERTATLDVAILDPNYAPVRQTVTLRIATLPYPARAEAVGHVGAGRPPYNSATLSAGHLHNFKTGRYATATNFVVDPSSSPELTVDADTGIVGTNGDITEAGIYVLIVSVASPDYVGRARLALGLTLEGVFTDAETIADGDRSRTVAVASGHSGSVAFFAAGRDGVALRTPSSVPSGFTLGAGGVDADFAAPAGFTLFLDAGVIAGGETATAAFAVTASVAFFAVSEISLTVIVSALRTPPTASASGETFGLSASYEGDVVNLAGAGYEESAYFGAHFEETSSSDLSVAADGQVSTREKLGVGDYLLTVTVRGRPDSRASADAFIGEATITVSLRVEQGSEAITADDVVGASSRHVTLDAAAGYFGRGYAIPVSANYTLSGEVYDSNKLGYDDVNKVITILSGNRVPASGELTLTLSGDGGCDDGIRTCLTVPVSVTAVFRAVESPAQVGAEADYLRGFTVGLNLPQGYAAGENQPGRGLSLIVSEALSNVSLSLDGATDELAYAPNGVASDALSVGAYTVTVALTATGLLGTVLMEFAATVRALDLDSADYGLPQPEEVTVASGYTGYLHTDISLGASAADGVLSALSGAFPSGVSLSLLSDSRGVAAHLTQGLDGVSFRPEVTLTVSRGANYNPLEQIATLLVTALRTPPVASASGETFGFSASYEGDVVNLAGAGYEESAYSGGRFEETSSADLSVAADGQVSARKKLGALATIC